MSQMKSMLLAMLFFVGFIVPAFLLFFIDSTNQNAFLKTTKEITELVKEDAGVSDRVKSVVNDYKTKGYTISFTDQYGQPVNGIANYGDTIQVHYQYTFKSVFKDQTLESSNKVFILKRNGENRPGWDNGGELQPRTVVKLTTESKNVTHEETFVIPGMTRLRSVTSNTGSVEVVKVEGNRVTVRATNGSPSKKVQTGGTVMADDTKIVTETIVKTNEKDLPNTITYSEDVYEGTLNRNGAVDKKQTGGEFIPAQTKEVGNQPSPDYSDSEGFKGTLERYVHSGEYTPEQSKFVEAQETQNYIDDEGFRGILSKYLYDVEVTPEHTRFVRLNHSGETAMGKLVEPSSKTYQYNRDGYVGVLDYVGYIGTAPSKPVSETINCYNAISSGYYVYQNGRWKSRSGGSGCGQPNYYEEGSWFGRYTEREEITLEQPYFEYKIKSSLEGIKTGTREELKLSSSGNVSVDEIPHLFPNPKEGDRIEFNKITTHLILSGTAYDLSKGEVMWRYEGYVTRPAVEIPLYRYQGVVTKPAVDTRVWRYGGKVTKPAVDTRTYEYTQEYKGTATKKGLDTRTYDTYYQYRLTFEYE
ncbi:hypothetical protein JOC94_003053 [Bacillus thermophilus]|uniref:Uncharacterized protein n=1 Tax=Siminovitchia thermophila TaxID=1245522 RepID=A0ABS2R8R3_9BACI|nr:hypothetical protein [Siminovitchia thermophila]MBM7716042.1 hypothetical protein [Siminovitchia thermophila]